MEKDGKHTPGPWRRFGGAGDGYGIVDADGAVIIPQEAFLPPATIDAIVRDHNERPDLLAALRACVNSLRTFRGVPKDEQEWVTSDSEAIEAGFAAIARATGGES